MKKITLLLFLFFLCNITKGQSIFTNPITGSNPGLTNPYTTGQIIDPNISVSGIGRGTGVIGRPANDRYNAQSWETASLDNTAYFEFTMTPNTGYKINFTSFVYTGQTPPTGPSSFAFRSSIDGFVSNIGAPTGAGTTIDLTATTYQNITGAITFRLYGWGATGANRTFSINDFTFNGTAVLICPGTTTTWDGTSWTNGIPDITTPAVINGTYTTNSINGSFSTCSLTINTNGSLTIDNGYYVEVEHGVIVNGELFVETQGNFVQNDDSDTFIVNSGGISRVNKQTASKQAWYYYTYWSSPVSGETITNAFPNTSSYRRFWFNAVNYLDTDGDEIDDNGDDWTIAAGTDVMAPGVGYAATSSKSSIYPSTDLATFTGPFNTGNITTGISYNIANTLGSWNFIGNPYPSAIDFIAFHTANSTIIEGTAYFWSQSSPPSSSNPGNEQENFNQNDYATYTVGTGGAAGASGITPNQYVPSGQGFFIAGLANGNATFTNAMRMADGTSNSQFFKNVNKKRKSGNLENKLWVNLTSDNGVFNQILIGYVAGATNADDGLFYDAPKLLANEAAILYSRVQNSIKKFTVQGKAENSLDTFETIKLGFKNSINVPTIYKLTIAQLQGEFLTNNPIYLKDNLLDITHSLSDSDYTFTSEIGEFEERFEIVFNQNSLTTNETSIDENTLKIITQKDDKVQFISNNSLHIKSITILDLLGRQLYYLKGNSNTETYTLTNLKNTIYIAKVQLSNEAIITRKILNK